MKVAVAINRQMVDLQQHVRERKPDLK